MLPNFQDFNQFSKSCQNRFLEEFLNFIFIWRRCFSNWVQSWLLKLSSPNPLVIYCTAIIDPHLSSPGFLLFCHLDKSDFAMFHYPVIPKFPQWYIVLQSLIHLYLLQSAFFIVYMFKLVYLHCHWIWSHFFLTSIVVALQ